MRKRWRNTCIVFALRLPNPIWRGNWAIYQTSSGSLSKIWIHHWDYNKISVYTYLELFKAYFEHILNFKPVLNKHVYQIKKNIYIYRHESQRILQVKPCHRCVRGFPGLVIKTPSSLRHLARAFGVGIYRAALCERLDTPVLSFAQSFLNWGWWGWSWKGKKSCEVVAGIFRKRCFLRAVFFVVWFFWRWFWNWRFEALGWVLKVYH